MTAPTLVLPGGPAHRDDPATWTIPPTAPDVHAWREQQHAKRGGLIASMRLRNAEKFALEQAHRAAQEKSATPPAPRRHRGPDKAPRPRPAQTKHARWRAQYEAGATSSEIAAAEGTSKATVLAGLAAAGTTMRPGGGSIARPLDEAAVCAQYQAGDGLETLARRHHVAERRIRDAVVAAGIPLRARGGGEGPWADPAWVTRVNTLLDAGLSRVAVAAEVGASRQQIERWTIKRRRGEA